MQAPGTCPAGARRFCLELEEADDVRYSSLKRTDDPRDGLLCFLLLFFVLLLLSFRSLSFPDNLEEDVEDPDADESIFIVLMFLLGWPSVFLFLCVLTVVLIFMMMGVRWIWRRILTRNAGAVQISGCWAKMTYHLMLTPISPLFLRPFASMRLLVFSCHGEVLASSG